MCITAIFSNWFGSWYHPMSTIAKLTDSLGISPHLQQLMVFIIFAIFILKAT